MTHAEVIFEYGRFMVAWSVLETVIEAAIMKLLRLDAQRALIVTTSMQFRQRINVLYALLEIESDNNQAAIKLLKRIEKDAKRNMLVHGHIIVGVPGQLTFVKSNIVDGYAANRCTFCAADLKAHTLRIVEKTNSLHELLSVTDADIQTLADVGIVKSSPT